MFELFVARRYLSAKRKQVVLSVISVISVMGVAAGVMAMIIALAINTGFRNTLERSFLGATAHVFLLSSSGEGIAGWRDLEDRLKQIPHVESVAPALYDSALLSGPVNSQGVQVKGISVDPGAPVPDMLRNLKEGSFDGLRATDGLPGIILGTRLATEIGATVDKPINLVIPNGRITPFGVEPSLERMRVVGLFESGVYDLDATWAFLSLADTQRLFDYGDIVNSIEMNLDDIYQAPEVAQAAQAIIGPDLKVSTWQEQNRPLIEAFRTERRVTVIIILLIQMVAAMNILITLVMLVMEKHRDIAILMSMGARASQIRRIFVYEGGIIGVTGTALGLIAGYTLSYLANRYEWIALDEQVYSLSHVPLEAHWIDGVWVAAAAIAISLIATLYPARSATRVEPVEAMRYE